MITRKKLSTERSQVNVYYEVREPVAKFFEVIALQFVGQNGDFQFEIIQVAIFRIFP